MTSAEFELTRELEPTFPQLERIVGRFGEATRQERIPLVFLVWSSLRRPAIAAVMCCLAPRQDSWHVCIAAILLAFKRLTGLLSNSST